MAFKLHRITIPVLKTLNRIHARRLLSYGTTLRRPITYATLNCKQQSVEVEFNGNQKLEFPWLFLQDNCTCSDCFHASSQSRKRKMIHMDLENDITKVSFGDDSIVCTWKDGHKGSFPEQWLLDRSFSEENCKNRKMKLRDRPSLVGANYTLERDTFQNVLNCDKSLLKLLKSVATFGAFMVQDAPKEVKQLRKLAARIGFIRLTHYGNEFTVRSEANAVNLAYTSDPLCVHTDLPYYAYPPGVQVLHCIKQYPGEVGGHSICVDGFLVADQMRRMYPQEYEILSTTPVEFYDIGKDYTSFHKVHHSPTFVHESGRLTRIVYSNQVLSSYQPIALERVKPFYRALKLFTDLCYHKDNLMRFKLKEGEMFVFDNWRFLHGREGFDPTKHDRHLEGCYIDWDEMYCRINVIENSLNTPTQNKT